MLLSHLSMKRFCVTWDTQIQKLLLVIGSSRLVAVNVVNVSHISSEFQSFVVPCN